MEYVLFGAYLFFSLVMPILVYFIYKNGISDGIKLSAGKSIDVPFKILPKKEETQLTEQELKEIEYHNAIMNYTAGGK